MKVQPTQRIGPRFFWRAMSIMSIIGLVSVAFSRVLSPDNADLDRMAARHRCMGWCFRFVCAGAEAGIPRDRFSVGSRLHVATRRPRHRCRLPSVFKRPRA